MSKKSTGLLIMLASHSLLPTSCRPLKEDENHDTPSQLQHIETSNDAAFSGFVQKAFTIKVNDLEFSDSEDFFTRFITELVGPDYPDLDPGSVHIEGRYGLEEFGTASKVFISSMGPDGHLFEGRTDAKSAFVVKVQTQALDEVFKARVIIRIGLEIETADADPSHYCYLLFGTKDGISIGEANKPVIFDDFKTQLDTYKCEESRDDRLRIPGADISTPDQDDAATFPSPLNEAYVGNNTLTAITRTPSGTIFAVKAAVKRKEDGKWCYPLIKIPSLGGREVSDSCVLATEQDLSLVSPIGSIILVGEYLVGNQGGNLVSFAEDGSKSSATPMRFGGSWQKVEARLVLAAGQPKLVDGTEVCDVTMAGSTPYTNCKPAPSSNACDLGYPKAIAWFDGAFLAANGVNNQGSGYCGASAIHELSPVLGFLRTHELPSTDWPTETFRNSLLIATDENPFVVSLQGDELIFRRVALDGRR